ncbi:MULTISPECIES: PRC-barrel domain containing protein [Paracoccus]|uniref:PRC-barrel domain containing protein n=1 Tax=Paracoccus litorisediminis TaxID=2006130 RepID=A0A844HJ87_9RHOB|nr:MULTISPECIES: PRC-barrel domain containing protein [Paracoccus]MBD9527377.1 PRC-barrel domain containing protein [Paracoccus sp. PAR01]MTH60223.1 PRC-barrel domain containing protein [Paracoccus litorisediminis]
MDHAMHERLKVDELTEAILGGATVLGPEEERVGIVSHLHGSGADALAIVDVGGILGFGTRPVAVSMRDLDFMRDDDGHVHAVTRYNKRELKEMPVYRH